MRLHRELVAPIVSAALVVGIVAFTVAANAGMASLSADGASASAAEREGASVAHVVDDESAGFRDRKTLYENDDDTSVEVMYLTVMGGNAADNTNHSWAEVNEHGTEWYDEQGIERYKVEGILQVGDEDGPVAGAFGFGETASNCTVQVRGQTSSRADQKNYKVRIKDGKGTWRGQRTIALNKHVSNATRFMNKLSYDLMKQVPELVSARTQFVRLYVRDLTAGPDATFVDYGLFTQVEQINRTYLENHGLDRNGQLYKVTFFEWDRYDAVSAAADPDAFDERAFESYLETKGNDDHRKLLRAIDAVNDYTIPIEEVVADHFDAENLCYWMAFHILTGNYDTGARNLYLYSPLNSERWYVISWDNDASFRRAYYRVVARGVNGVSWERGLAQFTGLRLTSRMLRKPEYRAMLVDAVRDLRQHYLTNARVSSMVASYAGVVKPYVMREPDAGAVTSEQYDELVASIPAEMEENYQYFMESLDNPWPFFVGVPFIEGGRLTLAWDAAWDPAGEDLTYHYRLSSDVYGRDVIDEGDTVTPMYTREPLPAGTYFLSVNVTNESGLTQDCYDYYLLTGVGKIYATICFRIGEDGIIENITEGGAE